MTTYDFFSNDQERFQSLIEMGLVTQEELRAAAEEAARRGIELERILRHDYFLPRRQLLEALSRHYRCPWVEYDERRPIPPELLSGLDIQRLCLGWWIPLAKDDDTVVIAAADPGDQDLLDEARRFFPRDKLEFQVALEEDIQFFIQDFLNGPPTHIIGNERTGLAFWRNTMARWRTRLACYRTDFAKTRTNLSLLRGGLGLIAIAQTLKRLQRMDYFPAIYWVLIASGLLSVLLGLLSYLKIRKAILSPPRHQTLVEVTAATLYFLENYQFAPVDPRPAGSKGTMLARLVDSLPNHCIYMAGSTDNKVRSSLAHERNLLSAQRTLAACYRTIYSRARTGLSFIRSGVAFISIGFGLIAYFGPNIYALPDIFIIISGIFMAVDGAIWYLPVRKEQSEVPRYLMPE